jgi:hypothetical protein
MTIDKLLPGTSYDIWVTATTECGQSNRSAPTKNDTVIESMYFKKLSQK